MSAATAPALAVTEVSVSYGDIVALADVSLEVAPGLVCGLIGMNGSGKSTLFKAVMGLVATRSGTVAICGGDPGCARKRGWVGYVPQAEAIDHAFPLSVGDVVMQGRYGFLGFTRTPRSTDHAAVARALETVGLADLATRTIGDLSGGQRKRVFVARALAQGARLLLLDEPFAGVDRTSEARITALLRTLAARGVAVLISTHGLSAVPDLCDDVVLLNRRVVARGAPEEILHPDLLAEAFTTPGEER